MADPAPASPATPRPSALRQALSFGWFAVPSVVILLGLGFWQLARLEWKESLLADLATLGATPPLDLGQATPQGLFSLQEYQPVQLRGAFLPALTLIVAPRTLPEASREQAEVPPAQNNGAWIIRPVVASPVGSKSAVAHDSALFWVVQGWLPFAKGEAVLAALPPAPEGEFVLTGVLRFGGWYGREFLRPTWPTWVPTWKPTENASAVAQPLYPWVDPEAFSALLSQQLLVQKQPQAPPPALGGIGYITLSAYPQATSKPTSARPTAGEPLPLPSAPNLRNQHANYARTWFLLAAALLALWFLRLRDGWLATRRAEQEAQQKSG